MPPGRLSDKVSGAPGFALSRDRAFFIGAKAPKINQPRSSLRGFLEKQKSFYLTKTKSNPGITLIGETYLQRVDKDRLFLFTAE